jgi:hypothetical protein
MRMARFTDDNGDPSAVMPNCIVSVDWRGHGRIAIETITGSAGKTLLDSLFVESPVPFASIESPTDDEKKAAVAAVIDEIDAALNYRPTDECRARSLPVHIPPPLYGGDGSGQ